MFMDKPQKAVWCFGRVRHQSGPEMRGSRSPARASILTRDPFISWAV